MSWVGRCWESTSYNSFKNASFRNAWKKDVKPSQLRRLQKRADARAEQSSVAAAEQAKDYTTTQNIESEKDAIEQDKVTTDSAGKDMALKGIA